MLGRIMLNSYRVTTYYGFFEFVVYAYIIDEGITAYIFPLVIVEGVLWFFVLEGCRRGERG